MEERIKSSSIKKSLMRSFFYGFKQPKKSIVAKDIGYDWHPFTEGTGDYIKALDTKEDKVTVYLYKAPKGLIFNSHFHLPQVEFISFLYGEAEVKVLTINGDIDTLNLSGGDVISFPNNEDHKFTFLEDSMILITYYPEFSDGNWNAIESSKI